jgi:cytochrome d ubiquinol oxidase subunit II
MPLDHWLAGAVLVTLTLYALAAGADFGGGVWDLVVRGPRAKDERELIAHALGPIWEANHVWLILLLVLLFSCFPGAFAALMTALHVPLMLLLLGVVLRGSAFAFRSYGDQSDRVQAAWGRVFAVASLVSPLMLGACVGTIAAGGVVVENGRVPGGFFAPWLAPFPQLIGVLALSLFAFLAAVYLTVEAGDPELREVFRRRALASGLITGLLAFAALALASSEAPLLFHSLVGRAWSLPFHLLTGAVAVGALLALRARRYVAARALAMLQVTLVLWGWGFAQFPYVVPPQFTFTSAAAPPRVLGIVLVALGAGTLLLAPSLWYLFRVFKAPRTDSRPQGRI